MQFREFGENKKQDGTKFSHNIFNTKVLKN